MIPVGFIVSRPSFAEDAFAQLYGPLAKSQSDGMAPIVAAFLEGTLPPMS